MMTEDEILIKSVIAGDNGAFVKLVEKYKKLVSHIVFRMISNESDREDICQDVFIKVYQGLPSFRFQSRVSTWIGRIAYNTSLSYIEKMRLPLYKDIYPEEREIDEVCDHGARPDIFTESRDLANNIAGEIDKLPVIYGTILSLYHLEEMTYKEIATIMKLPDGTVKSYLFRARNMLKDRLLSRFRREEL